MDEPPKNHEINAIFQTAGMAALQTFLVNPHTQVHTHAFVMTTTTYPYDEPRSGVPSTQTWKRAVAC